MKRLLIALLVCSGLPALAQDPQLSQYYAAPLYLNPAFTGNLDYDCRRLPESRFRFTGNYRNQYAGNMVTSMAAFDYLSKNANWGFGILAYQDVIGTTPLKQVQIAGLASYKLHISNDWRLHSGLQAGYGNRTASLSNFTFPDQFSERGLTGATSEPSVGQGGNVGYPDVSAGLLVFNESFYMGSAVHHLNQPNQSLIGGTEKMPMKFSVHTGYKIGFSKTRGFRRKASDKSITPTIHYKKQGVTQQLDIGSYFAYDPVVLGVWFRGLPVLKSPDGSRQRDAVVLLLGVRQPTDFGLFKLGVSYDFPVSQAGLNSGRTFEVSVGYQIINERCRKRVTYLSIPCPGI